jgi:hypothetical protein
MRYRISLTKKDEIRQAGRSLRDAKPWMPAYWVLLVGWVSGATLFMAGIKGGFLTNYLSDLAFPAWFYIYIRGLSERDGCLPNLLILRDWAGQTPERALLSILAVGIASELKTKYWPGGVLAGTFDYWDMAAYALGLLACYYFDRRQIRRGK